MVAVVSGNGLGLFDKGLASGLPGTLGNAGIGQGRGAQFFNVANGNLVLQGTDEALIAHGLPASLLRTYNSQGTVAGAGADGWTTGFEKSVALVSGTLNTAGSTVKRVTADGDDTLFSWDAAKAAYVATDGDSAHDELRWNGSTWTYVEGSSRSTETYDSTGRLTGFSDPRSGAAFTVSYDGSGRVSEVGQVSGEALVFGYDGSGRISSLSTREAGVTRLQVSYGYDASGRLQTVTTDLTPDNSGDSAVFTTTYAYESTSLRISQVSQSDGTVTSYTYAADGKVATITVGDINTNDADGAGHTITLAYRSGETDLTDSTGKTWTYKFDANGRVTEVLTPAVGGQRLSTRYTYDSAGNLSTVTDPLNFVTTYGYDANGNRVLERDAAGDTVTRTFSATNQVLTETRYKVADPDGAGAALPSGAETLRYAYDSADRLRYSVSATGEVTEFSYFASGVDSGLLSGQRRIASARYDLSGLAATDVLSVATLDSWRTGKLADSQLVTFTYDARGQLSQRTAYATVDAAGVGVTDAATDITRNVYDAQGLLRQSITVRGASRTVLETTSFVYDGMGRLLSSTDALGVATTRVYDDANRKLSVTTADGRLTVELRNAAGELVDLQDGLVGQSPTGTTHYAYDTAGKLRMVQDANNARSYSFYDAAGRVQAAVDATGAAVEYSYDADSRVTGETHYWNLLSTGTWYSGTAVTVSDFAALRPASHANDRGASRAYDSAGRLSSATDALGTVTTYAYDGANRLLSTTTVDRTTSFFYDADGRRLATLDAMGYLTETVYDAAGRVAKTIAYATAASAGSTLDAVRPSTASGDQTTRYYYDAMGRQVGALDAEGYLSESVYDAAANQRAAVRYGTKLTGLTGNETFAALKASVVAGAKQETRNTFDADNRLITTLDFQGTVTRYAYDSQGRLVKTTFADATTEVRENNRRYDALGNLIGELGGEGSTHLAPGMTQPQLDAVYTAYGTRHIYDALGRRTESTDAQGNKTWFFYDLDGRQTHTVRGVNSVAGVQNGAGEVERTVYTAFGQAAQTVKFVGTISTSNLAATIAALQAVGGDESVAYAYDKRGALLSRTDALGYLTSFSYTAFGELYERTDPIWATINTVTRHAYDKRGQLTSKIEDYGTGTLNRTTSQTYDAFGRVATSTDGLGRVTSYGWDRLGRQVTTQRTVQGSAQVVTTAYDGFSRTLSTTDPMGRVTSYAYDDTNRTVSVTTPEGVAVTTWTTRHGQTLKVVDAAGSATQYSYDRDGHLLTTTDANGAIVSNSYDVRGLVTRTTDATGNKVDFSYDAVGRVLTRNVDPNGLALVTRYEYDARGLTIRVTDPTGVKTKTDFRANGTKLYQYVDEGGLNLKTYFFHDRQLRTTNVQEAYGTSEQREIKYNFDSLGRLTSEVRGPTGAQVTTSYSYDAADNVGRKVDANGKATRYSYDEANRLVFTVDALGGVTRNSYDADGRLTSTVAYATALSAGEQTSLANMPSISAVAGYVDLDPANDRSSYTVYDRDGRVRYAIDGSGAVTEQRYDTLGRASESIRYANRATLTAQQKTDLQSGAMTVAAFGALLSASSTTDVASYTVRDAVGRERFTVTSLGNGQARVMEREFDSAGRVTRTLDYGVTIAYAPSQTVAQTETAITAAGGDVATASRETRYYYDAAGRSKFTVDDLGYVTESFYDAASRLVESKRYDAPINAAGAVTTTDIYNRVGWAESFEDTTTPGLYRDLIDSAAGAYSIRSEPGRLVFDSGPNPTANWPYVRRTENHLLSDGVTTRMEITTGAIDSQSYSFFTLQNDGVWDQGFRRIGFWVGAPADGMWVSDYQTTVAEEGWYDMGAPLVANTTYIVDLETSATAVTIRAYQKGTPQADAHVYTIAVDSADWGATHWLAHCYVGPNNDGGPVYLDDLREMAKGRSTKYSYDAAGRLSATTDALGNTERYGYDLVGNRTSLTNAKGDAWTYAYDKLNRLTDETTPTVTVATVGSGGAITTTTRAVVTHTDYDTLGNVTKRTENSGQADARETSYGYDSTLHQTSVSYSAPGSYSSISKQVSGQAPGGMQNQVKYDALGQAYANKDVNNNWSYKVYDSVGRVRFDVDAEGFVTEHSYDAFGNETTLKRYAAKLTNFDAWTAGNQFKATDVVPNLPTSAADRTITTSYDVQGRKTAVTMSAVSALRLSDGVTYQASPQTSFTFDAAGNLVKESVRLEQLVGGGYDYADTYHYYDALGRRTMSVDAEGQVTTWTYDLQGQLASTTEYARSLDLSVVTLSTSTPPALPGAGSAEIGYDRTTRYGYDALGRKVSETTTRRFADMDGNTLIGDSVTTSEYDALGNVTAVVANGVRTETTYDKLGHALTLKGPSHAVLNLDDDTLQTGADASALGTAAYNLARGLDYTPGLVNVSVVTEFTLDAYGNAVKMTRAAKTAAGAVIGDDETTYQSFDAHNRLVAERRVVGTGIEIETVRTYDAAGQVLTVRNALASGSGTSVHGAVTVEQAFTYDRNGRQTVTETKRSYDATTVTDSRTMVAYNAFGEINGRGDTVATLEQYVYDAAGRLSSSTGDDGLNKTYAYNLAGYQVKVARPGSGDTLVYGDKLGRTIRQEQAPLVAGGARPVVSLALDRWGNVLAQVDARGYLTSFEYDQANQRVREVKPTVKTVHADGTASYDRPETRWSYDIKGQLIAERDAAGNIRRRSYDAAGELTTYEDALHNLTRFGYDGLGRQVAKQDALGNVSVQTYDGLGRVVNHGDVIASGAGYTVQTLEGYVYDELGDRIQVTRKVADVTGATTVDSISKYDFDSRHMLVRSQTAEGVVQTYGYDLQGRKVLESNALTHADVTDNETGFDAVTLAETVRTNELTWNYDYFGRVTDHNDLSAKDYEYSYSNGQLVEDGSAWTRSEGVPGGVITGTPDYNGTATQHRTYTYFANGQLKQIDDLATGAVYKYEYDAAGNRVLEDNDSYDANGLHVHSRTRTYFDSNGRISRVVSDDAILNVRTLEAYYEYDILGNRRHVRIQSKFGTDVAPIAIGNRDPLLQNAPANRSARVGREMSLSFEASDLFTDPDAEALTFTAGVFNGTGTPSALPSWMTFEVADNHALVFKGTPPANLAGNSYQLQISARDAAGAAVTTVFSLNLVTNTAPTAKQTALPQQLAKIGKAFAYEVSAADAFTELDVDDSLTLTLEGTVPAWLHVDDIADGTIVFYGTPAVADTGTYTFTVRATDQNGVSATTQCSIQVRANALPVGTNRTLANAVGGRAYSTSIAVSDVFTDADGDRLAYSIVALDAQGNEQPLPTWLKVNYDRFGTPPKFRVVGTPPEPTADYTYQIRVRAMDTEGAIATATLSFLVDRNDGPTVLGTPVATTRRVATLVDATYDMTAMFSDPQGDSLSYEVFRPTASAQNSWLESTTYYRVSDGHMMMRLVGTSPASVAPGTITFEVRASDYSSGTPLSNSAYVNVILTPETAPLAHQSLVANQSRQAERALTYALPAGTFTDAESDALTYSGAVHTTWQELVDDDGEDGGSHHWETFEADSPLPSWLTVDPATGTLSGTPPASAANTTLDVRVYANDGILGAGVQFTLTITPFVNQAPTAGTIANYAANEDQTINYAPTAGTFVDPDNEGLTYTGQILVGGNWVAPTALGLNIASNNGALTGPITGPTQGSYTVKITATDYRGATISQTYTLTVNRKPTGPSSLSLNVGNHIAFSNQITGFSDPEGTTLSYSATLNTGAALPAWLTISSTGLLAGTPPNSGTTNLLITITDQNGVARVVPMTLNTSNNAPTYTAGSITASQSTPRNQPYSYTVPSSAFTDPNGDNLSYSAYQLVGGNEVALPGWISFDVNTRVFTASAPPTVGSYVLGVRAADPNGSNVSATFTLAVINSQPAYTAGSMTAQTATASSAFSYVVPSGAFSDPNSDGLTYTAAAAPGYTWPSWLTFTPGTRTFSGTSTTAGTWVVRVTASDGSLTAYGDLTISTANATPVYAGGLAAQSVAAGASANYQFPTSAFTDANLDTPTYSATLSSGAALPSWITFNASTRTFTIAPTNLPVQTVTVRVKAQDGGGLYATGDFNVNVLNGAPAYAGGLTNQSVSFGNAWSYQFSSANFTDPNGDTITFSASGMPAWMSFNASTRTFSGTPTSAGSWTVQAIATDPSNATGSGSFTMTATNAAPTYTAGTIVNQSGNATVAFNYTLPSNTFVDSNGETPTYYAGQITTHQEWVDLNGNDHLDPGEMQTFDDLVALPSWLSFNASTRSFSGTPSSTGSYTIEVGAYDGAGASATHRFTLTIGAAPNQAPVYNSGLSNRSTSVGAAFSYQFGSTAFTDANGDALTYSATLSNGSALPSWLSFNASTRTFSGTPTATGTITVRVKAQDPSATYATGDFTITVSANTAPVVSVPLDDGYAVRYEQWDYTFPSNSFTDPEGQTLTYTALKSSGAALPSWLTFNASTRSFSGTPTGTIGLTVRVTATDTQGLSVYDDFVITIDSGGGGNQAQSTQKVQNSKTSSSLLAFGVTNTLQRTSSYSPEEEPILNEQTPAAGPGDSLPANANVKDYWYDYDLENRVTVVDGSLSNGHIVTSELKSFGQQYDAVGNVIVRTTMRNLKPHSQWMVTGDPDAFPTEIVTDPDGPNGALFARRFVFDAHGREVQEFGQGTELDQSYLYNAQVEVTALTETRQYDLAGNLLRRDSFSLPQVKLIRDRETGVYSETNTGGWLMKAEVTRYDLDGRVRKTENYGRGIAEFGEEGDDGFSSQVDLSALLKKNETDYTNGSAVHEGVTYQYGYDAAGRLLGYHYENYNPGMVAQPNSPPPRYSQWYGFEYLGREGYLEKKVFGDGDSFFKAAHTQSIYDADGNRTAVLEDPHTSDVPNTVRYFSYDGEGHILTKRFGNPGSGQTYIFGQGYVPANTFTQSGIKAEQNEFHYYSNGNHLGYLTAGDGKNAGETGADGKGQIHFNRNLTEFESGDSVGKYTVAEGDTLQTIAQKVYGNGEYWYVIAEANSLTDDADLRVGTEISTPILRTHTNNANTFRPYDASKIVGSTVPNLPFIPPPPPMSWTAIIAIVILIVVTIFTAGAAAMAASAAAETAGTVAAGTTAALGTGISATFTTGLSAMAGGLGTGIGLSTAVTSATLGAAVGSIASQAVLMTDGKHDFDLKQVGVSALTAGLTAWAGGSLFGDSATFAKSAKLMDGANKITAGGRAVMGAMGAASSAIANQVVTGHSGFSWSNVAASAIASTVSGTDPLTAQSGGLGDFASDMLSGIVNRGVHEAVLQSFGDGGHFSAHDALMDTFGNALGNAAVRGLQVASLSPSERDDYHAYRDKYGWSHAEALDQARKDTAYFTDLWNRGPFAGGGIQGETVAPALADESAEVAPPLAATGDSWWEGNKFPGQRQPDLYDPKAGGMPFDSTPESASAKSLFGLTSDIREQLKNSPPIGTCDIGDYNDYSKPMATMSAIPASASDAVFNWDLPGDWSVEWLKGKFDWGISDKFMPWVSGGVEVVKVKGVGTVETGIGDVQLEAGGNLGGDIQIPADGKEASAGAHAGVYGRAALPNKVILRSEADQSLPNPSWSEFEGRGSFELAASGDARLSTNPKHDALSASIRFTASLEGEATGQSAYWFNDAVRYKAAGSFDPSLSLTKDYMSKTGWGFDGDWGANITNFEFERVHVTFDRIIPPEHSYGASFFWNWLKDQQESMRNLMDPAPGQ